jgi:hypothetical protein
MDLCEHCATAPATHEITYSPANTTAGLLLVCSADACRTYLLTQARDDTDWQDTVDIVPLPADDPASQWEHAAHAEVARLTSLLARARGVLGYYTGDNPTPNESDLMAEMVAVAAALRQHA